MKKLTLGPCPVCEKTIWTLEGGSLRLNEQGTYFWIRSNNNTVAKFSICKDCLKTLDMAQVSEIVDRQVLTWITELLDNEGGISRTLFDKYRFYAALEWADNEEKILKALEGIRRCRQMSY